jgi:hypothetical protein
MVPAMKRSVITRLAMPDLISEKAGKLKLGGSMSLGI